MEKHKLTLTLTDKELDILTSMLDLCCRSIQIIADDPNNPLNGLHEFERTEEEKELAKGIIQKIGRECL